MIAIKDQDICIQFFSAINILSILDTVLADAQYGVSAAASRLFKGSQMGRFHEDMCEAKNLHKAAKKALKKAGADLLSEDSVRTFYMLTEYSLLRAISALNFAVQQLGEEAYTVGYRDRLTAAMDSLYPKTAK